MRILFVSEMKKKCHGIYYRDDDLAALSGHLHRFSVLSSLQECLRKACDTSAVAFWHRERLPEYLQHVFDEGTSGGLQV